MNDMILGNADLVLFGSIAATLLALCMGVAMATYAVRVARLDPATKLTNVRSLLEIAEDQLKLKREELSILDRKMTDRDFLIAEIAGLTATLERLRAEYAALEDARREIEEVQRLAANAAEELAEKTQARDAILGEHERMMDEVRRGNEMLEGLVDRERAAREGLEAARASLAEAETALAPLRIERDAALRVIDEARHASERIADLQRREAELAAEAARLQSALDPLRRETDAVLAKAAAARAALDAVSDTVRGLEARKAALETEIEALARKSAAVRRDPNDPPEPLDEAALLGELLLPPDCVKKPAVLRGKASRTEEDAIQDVAAKLRGHGLNYHERTLRGFHTSLKINDVAQITVLAGVSGTGKSLLPRRYAEALGIHFLQIAVEPRWDSPQDLLGFYNYIEKKYRATDLARLLAHMDPFDTAKLLEESGEKGKSLGDRMALVLLDEMNLARIEYYFSEFLSRLEARAPYGEGREPGLDATIPIDIRGLDRSLRLFPSHNVLFAGTMNDDESTQALSPKVMDRGNVLQFAAPAIQADKAGKPAPPTQAEEAQRFGEWRTWVGTYGAMTDSQRSQVDSAIAKIAEMMERFDRPIGYRMRDAMRAYCANYPPPGGRDLDVRRPLADQVEFRILPRLRGVDIERNRPAFEQLDRLLRDLDDAPLADRLGKLVEDQGNSPGLFSWRGFTRA
ncbi:MAG: hypothetical protein ACE37J_05020 [Pikeienuella sp.]|uniref:hypothetical protein n=1 Tax=Pikeienuella sp. TaxID=2831957 RepID=UPI00391D3C25